MNLHPDSLVQQYNPAILTPDVEEKIRLMLDTPEFRQFLLREGIGIMLSNGVDLENNAGIAHLPGLIKGVNRGVLLFLEAIYPQIGE